MSGRGLNLWVNIGGNLLPSLNSSASAVEKRMGAMVRTFKLRTGEMKAEWRGFSRGVAPLAGLAAAGGLAFSAKLAIGDSAELAHELQMLRNAGRTSKEVAQSMAAANRTMRQIPTSTLTDNLRVLNETTMAFGGFRHAAENLSFVQKMSGMLQNALGDEGALTKDSAYSLIKALEVRGMGTKRHMGFDSGRFQSEAGMLYQASLASGGKVTPEEFFNFTKKSAPFVQGFSNRFLYRIAPTLIQEQGGDIAGTQASTWMGTILGKAKNKISTEAWMKLGLLDPKQVVYNKVGPVGWRPGAIKGTDLAMQDPLAWSEKVLIPALKAQGVDTNNVLSIQKAMMPLFRDRNANRLATMLVQQQTNTNLHKDEGLINKVPDVNKAFNDTLRNDPTAAWGAMKSSANNALSTMFLGAPGDKVNVVAVALIHVANGINSIATTFQAHPWLAKGVGVLLLGSAGLATLSLLGGGLGMVAAGLGGVLRIMSPLVSLAPMVLNGLVRLAPLVIRGLIAAFSLLSNPVGWGIILAGVAAALIYYFRGPLMAAWRRGWNALKSWALSVNWGAIGMTIANALTFGLAGKFAEAIGKMRGSVAVNVGMNVKGGGLAGMRANGGPVRAGGFYLVGERGPEIVGFGRNGYVTPNHHIRAMSRGKRRGRATTTGPLVGTLNINGVRDPHEVAMAVRHELNRLANGQAALLSD